MRYPASPKLKLRSVCVTIVLLGISLLFGCSNEEKRAEDAAYVQRIKNRRIREIEPLPEIRPYEPFAYSAFNLRSPFSPPVMQDQSKKYLEGGVHPDTNRRKEPLETFPLDSLRMVGTLEQHNKLWALVADPNGVVYRIAKGNYVGQNHGRIDNISNDKITLTEIVPDPSGGWRERPTSIGLAIDTKGSSQSGRR